jgi:oligopeptidase B
VEQDLRGAAVGSAGGISTRAPLAVREPTEHVIHGDRRVDHYAWMREKKDARVKEYLAAENAYADAVMRPTEALQEKLYKEMLGRIQQTDLSVPYRLRGYEYYTRTVEGKQYPIYCRKKATGDQRSATSEGAANESTERVISNQISEIRKPQEEVLLDLNELAAGHTYMGLGILEVSDDNRLLAYATDTTGYRQYTLEVKEIASGRPAFAEAPAGRQDAIGETGREEKLTEEERKLFRLRQVFGGPRKTSEKGERSPGVRRNERVPAREDRGEKRAGKEFRVDRVTSAAWAADNRTLFYVTEDEVTKRSNRLWRHEFGGVTEKAEAVRPEESAGRMPALQTDELIYEEKDERFRMDVERTRSGAYLLLVVNSHTTSEVRYLRASTPHGSFQLMAAREDEHEYYVDHHPGAATDPAGGIFFIRTNSGGRTYRLMTAPAEDPVRSRWREVIPNRPGVMLSGAEAFRTHLVLSEREDGLPYLRIVDLTREAPSALAGSWRMEFAEPTYSAVLGANPEFDTGQVRFQYESLVTPRSVYDHDLRTGKRILRKQQAVLGDFDPANYVSERLHARAKDGTAIPISVVRRKEGGSEEGSKFKVDSSRVQDSGAATQGGGLPQGLKPAIPKTQDVGAEAPTPGALTGAEQTQERSAPLLLYGYGSYGFSMPVSFSSNRLSLLDRGMVYAIAHIRGGGELGKPWHDAGRMHRKMNTFTDFIACAEFLIEKGYTSAEQLVIEGGSAGGLLMGAVTNMRPELFHVVVSHVPFVDVLNTMLDASLPLTVGEYEEWGNPQVEEDYIYMKQYCPYTNVERQAYPRMLVKTAWNDSQVMYWEAAKYVAKLRAMKTDGNVLLLKTNMGAGHGGASGRYDYLREIALDYAFVLGELGIKE